MKKIVVPLLLFAVAALVGVRIWAGQVSVVGSRLDVDFSDSDGNALGINLNPLAFDDSVLSVENAHFSVTTFVTLENPSPLPLRVVGLDYELRVGEREPKRGHVDYSGDSFRLPSRSETTIPLSAEISVGEVFPTIGDFFSSAGAEYQIDGVVEVDVFLGSVEVEFSASERWEPF